MPKSKNSGSGKARIETLNGSSFAKLPSINGGEHVIGALFEIGVTSITFQEIESWAKMTGSNFDTWSLCMIKRLSGVYSTQLAKSGEFDCPAPYSPQMTEDPRAVGAAVTAKFKALAKRRS